MGKLTFLIARLAGDGRRESKGRAEVACFVGGLPYGQRKALS